jgi:hypothetical protein
MLIWVLEADQSSTDEDHSRLDAVTSLEVAKASVLFSWHRVIGVKVEQEDVSRVKTVFTVRNELGDVIGKCTFRLAYVYNTTMHL